MTSLEQFKERFMKLEKVESPDEWVNKKNFKGLFMQYLDDTKEIDDLKDGLIVPNSDRTTFYKICEYLERKEVDEFKIYPILNRRYFVCEIKW